MNVGDRVSWYWCEMRQEGTILAVGSLVTVQNDVGGKVLLCPSEITLLRSEDRK